MLCFASWLHYIHYCGCERNEREGEEKKKEKGAATASERVCTGPQWIGEASEVRADWESRNGRTDLS